MFESWRGRYADSPRAVSEALPSDWRRIWVSSGNEQFPDDVEVVRRHSPAYFRRLLTADLLLSNDIISKHLIKGPRVTYVQTWHGTPLKLIGLDETQHSYTAADQHRLRMLRDIAKWDYLVSPSPACTEIFRSAFGFTGPVLETGYPRNDLLKAPDADERRRRTREALGIDPDALVMLYAPTWRDDAATADGRFIQPMGLDARKLQRLLPDNAVLLTRMHKNIVERPDFDAPGFVHDVSGHPEIGELYLAADVLISDYSSAIYDFAVTGKPIILFAYDLESYRSTVRGMYFDYETWAPGPIAQTTEDLAGLLGDLPGVRARHAGDYARFVQQFCPLEDGGATGRLVSAILDPPSLR